MFGRNMPVFRLSLPRGTHFSELSVQMWLSKHVCLLLWFIENFPSVFIHMYLDINLVKVEPGWHVVVTHQAAEVTGDM